MPNVLCCINLTLAFDIISLLLLAAAAARFQRNKQYLLRPIGLDLSNIKLFEDRKIRATYNEVEQKWFFAIIDVVQVLSGSTNARRYWSDLKRKLVKEGYFQLYENIVQLKMKSADGKQRNTDCADTEGLLRIIQSIPSPKAEPFKRWLAKVGYERLEEIENPELASKRAREIYKSKGYSEDWIEKRMRSIAIREENAIMGRSC